MVVSFRIVARWWAVTGRTKSSHANLQAAAAESAGAGAPHRRSLERLGHFAAGHRLAEHRVVAGGRDALLLAAGGGSTVGQRDHVVALLVGGAHGRLDAAVGQEAAQDHRLDLAAAQHEVEVGGRKRVQDALSLDDDVASCGAIWSQISTPQVPFTNAFESITPLRMPYTLSGLPSSP